MPRIVLASELLQRLRDETNTNNDPHLTDPEMYRFLTQGVSDTWDKLTSLGFGDEGIKNVTISVLSGTKEYSLATAAPDYFKVHTVYVDEGGGYFRPLTRISPAEEYAYRAPQTAASVKMYYLPCAPTFVTGNENFDGINGWEEHAIAAAGILVKGKKEDSYQRFLQTMQNLEARMRQNADRSIGEPHRIVRKRRTRDLFIPWNVNTIDAYDVRGGNIEFLYKYGVYR